MAELTVWPSDFGLPSVDPTSLHFLAVTKFCAAPIASVSSRDQLKPWRSPTGTLPVFNSSSSSAEEHCCITDFDEYVEYLRRSGQDVILNGQLSSEQRNELLAFSALLRDRLYPAVLYTLWLDEANFNTVTHVWYSRRLFFPYNLYFVQRERRKAEQYLNSLFADNSMSPIGKKEMEFALNKQAIYCISLLGAKLAEQKYFYGDRPTSLDGLVYGYLAPILKLPLPNAKLQTLLKSASALVRFVETVTSIYLPLTEEELRSQREQVDEWEVRRLRAQKDLRLLRDEQGDDDDSDQKPQQQQKHSDAKEDGEDFSQRDRILFGVAAGVLMLVASWYFGLLKLEIVKSEDGEEETRPVTLPRGIDFDTVFAPQADQDEDGWPGEGTD